MPSIPIADVASHVPGYPADVYCIGLNYRSVHRRRFCSVLLRSCASSGSARSCYALTRLSSPSSLILPHPRQLLPPSLLLPCSALPCSQARVLPRAHPSLRLRAHPPLPRSLHAEESGVNPDDIPHPVTFMKPCSSIIAPGENIVIPALENGDKLDYECELAMIIGKPCKDATVDNALSYVAGYTVANDVSARFWQVRRF